MTTLGEVMYRIVESHPMADFYDSVDVELLSDALWKAQREANLTQSVRTVHGDESEGSIHFWYTVRPQNPEWQWNTDLRNLKYFSYDEEYMDKVGVDMPI